MHFNTVLSLVGVDLHVVTLTGLLGSFELFPVDSFIDILDRLNYIWGCEPLNGYSIPILTVYI
jgi:hypothetical protein